MGFEDLPSGHINRPNPPYFQYLDRLIDILVEHEIVPVLQPVFQGFGWKGLGAAGTVVPPAEYARYCRYLVARYGARPAIYLVGADGSGYDPQVPAGGEEIERWDAYSQPTGIHYRPHADNRAWQDAPWLDFQWCQTGHSGEHLPERVADMWRNTPARGAANGEPTYEHSGRRGKKQAAVAVGHSILVVAYHLLERGVGYEELGGQYFEERERQAVERRLVHRLEGLGYKVSLEPAA